MASTYVGQYFKQHFQEDLQQYIIRNRLKIVENLLTDTTMSIKEIAAKMGYTDSCYLVRPFVAITKCHLWNFEKSNYNKIYLKKILPQKYHPDLPSRKGSGVCNTQALPPKSKTATQSRQTPPQKNSST